MAARPERVPAEEVRQRMLQAGRELALEAGAALTIEHLRLEEVIQRARVPRSSVYRLWPYREDYTDDLLSYLAGEGSWFSDRPVLDPETFTVVQKVLADNADLLGTMAGRRALMCEVVRLTAACNYESFSGSLPWRLHMALVATLGSTWSGVARKRIAAALEDAQRRSRESIVAALSYIAEILGLRLRDPAYTLDHVQLAGGLLVQSMALRNVQVQAAFGAPDEPAPSAGPADSGLGTAAQLANGGTAGAEADGQTTTALTAAEEVNRLLNQLIPGPGLHGQPAEWTLAGLSYLGVIDAFMELDPGFTPPAA
jgi:AcrR family transcriptional regulator